MRVPVQLKSEYLRRLINIPTRKSKVLLDVNDAAQPHQPLNAHTPPHLCTVSVCNTVYSKYSN